MFITQKFVHTRRTHLSARGGVDLNLDVGGLVSARATADLGAATMWLVPHAIRGSRE